ncbi:MAG: ribose-phosphate pyrophosphokinase [Deltaproteobacteria bacterium]|nr:ribose-phosphate pyrophosphokinase [Deltaproteobacteria bacterium]MBM4348194.1 ribose-phosphate pyrophosphokinase [Deltaproteobacteria bacterium]
MVRRRVILEEDKNLDWLKIFTGNSNMNLAEEVARNLGTTLGKSMVKNFSDGEINVEIDESVRGMDVFVVQSVCHPVNNNLMELLIIIDALKRASAERITAVLPYYGYARQDRKVSPRAPISAKLIADLITTAGASRVLTVDLHAGQIQGFFNIPVDHLFAAPVLLEYLRFLKNDLVIVSPDAGGVERARAYAKRLNASLAIIDKRREGPNVSQVMNIIGDVSGMAAILVDDLVDTGGTLVRAAYALIEKGAKGVYACCTHPVLSGKAVQIISESPIEEMIVTNTIPLREEAKACPKIKILSVSGLLADAIRRIYEDESVSCLFV